MKKAAMSYRRPKIGSVLHYSVILLKTHNLLVISARAAKSSRKTKTAHDERKSSTNFFIYNKCSAHDERSALASRDFETGIKPLRKVSDFGNGTVWQNSNSLENVVP